MSEKQVIGYCPECGCPIYQSVYWAGSGYPPAEYICKCNDKKLGVADTLPWWDKPGILVMD